MTRSTPPTPQTQQPETPESSPVHTPHSMQGPANEPQEPTGGILESPQDDLPKNSQPTPTKHPTRRTFIVGGASLAALAAAGFAFKPLLAEADVLRPPGSLTESEFMARCIKCDRCISVCPTDIIEPMTIEEGLLTIRTPKLNFSNDLCIFCDKCMEVCPTAAIGPVDPEKPLEGRIGVAIVHEDKCIPFHEAGACGICVDACEYDALSFDDARRPVVDDQLCNGCGECVRICPVNVSLSFGGGNVRGVEVVTEKRYREIGEEKA